MSREREIAAIEREIRRWDGVQSQADLQAVAADMAKRIRGALRRVQAPSKPKPRGRDRG